MLFLYKQNVNSELDSSPTQLLNKPWWYLLRAFFSFRLIAALKFFPVKRFPLV